MCSIRTGRDGSSAQWCDDRQKAVPIARAARRFAGVGQSLRATARTIAPNSTSARLTPRAP